MAIAQLFQNLHDHLPVEFAENIVTTLDTSQLWLLDFDESGVQIKNILESTYTDGITGLENVKNDGKQITGVFLDKISPNITKKYSFTVSPNNISYQLENPNDLEGTDFAELEFATPKMFGGSKKPKNCPNSTPCGLSCIKKGLKCSKPPNSEQGKAIAQLLDKGKKAPSTKATTKNDVPDTEKEKVARKTKSTSKRDTSGVQKKEKRLPQPQASTDLPPLKPVDIKKLGATSLNDIGNVVQVHNDELKRDKNKTDKNLENQFKNAKSNRNLTPGLVIETGRDEYEAIDDGFSQQLNNASASANKGLAFNLVVPNEEKQIHLAAALQHPDKDQKIYFDDGKNRGSISDYKNLLVVSPEEITTTKKGHDRSDEEVDRVAKQLRDAGGINWVPVLVRETGQDKYEVVGNHFAYEVAKKANITKIRTIVVEDKTTGKKKGNKGIPSNKNAQVEKTPESITKDFEQNLKKVTDLRASGDKEVAVQIAGAIDRADALRRAVASGSKQSIAEALPEAITKLRESKDDSPIGKFSKATLEYAKSQYDKLPDNLKREWANNQYTGLKQYGKFSQELYDNFANKSSTHKQIADDLKKYID
jgi:ribosomal protein S17E